MSFRLRFVKKESRVEEDLNRILLEIGDKLHLGKKEVNRCLQESLYQIQTAKIQTFRSMDEEDRVFFYNSLANAFQTKLSNEIETIKPLYRLKFLIGDAVDLAMQLK